MRMLLTHNPEGLFGHANWQGKIYSGSWPNSSARRQEGARTSYRRGARKIGVAPNKQVEVVSGLQKKSRESGSRVTVRTRADPQSITGHSANIERQPHGFAPGGDAPAQSSD